MSSSRKIDHRRRVLAHSERIAHEITDTQRIDYLEQSGNLDQFTRGEDGRWFDHDTDGSGSDYSPTLRDAIDRAIRALDELAASTRKSPRKITR